MIEKFVAALAPSLEKSQLLSQVDIVAEQIKDDVLPAYNAALKNNLFNRNYKLRSQWAQKRFSEFSNFVKVSPDLSVETITKFLEACQVKLVWVRKQIELNFEAKTYRDGITYPKAMVMQLFEAIAFSVGHAREFLIALYSHEVPSYWPENSDFSSPFTDGDMRRIEVQFVSFCRIAAEILGTRNLEAQLENIPDIVVDIQQKSGAAATVGHHRTQPIVLGFIDPSINPAAIIGKWYAERQVHRLNKAKKEKLALDFYLIQLKSSRDGKNNPAIEKQIESVSDDIKKLAYKIAEKEREYTRG